MGKRKDAHVDEAALRELVKGPGTDTRQWVSVGTVDATKDGPVTFDADEGYPTVDVTLQPSKVPVRCRVLMPAAGDQEAEWHPFVPGDEVLVALSRGSERDCVILGRLNNGIAKFPSAVAGQDPTTNSFGFTRRRTPFVAEYAGPYLVRQDTTGALLSIDAAGAVTLIDGSHGALQISADVFGYQSADAACVLQIDLAAQRFTMQAGDARLTLSGSNASPPSNAIVSPGPLSISASGNPAAEHLVTTEALGGILTQLLLAIGSSNPGPIIGAALGGSAPIIVAGALQLAAVTPLLPPVAAAVFAGFAAATAKPPGVVGLGQSFPGLGCTGILAG